MKREVVRWSAGLVALAASGIGLVACHRPTLVQGVVWFDADFDGIRDPGEAPAAGIAVEVDCHFTDPQVFDDGQCDTTTTDAEGRYELQVLVDPRGESQGLITFVAPPGFSAVEPPGVSWSYSITHREQPDFEGIDAALVSDESGDLGDFVWQDDGDGIQEDGEPGLGNIPVELQVGLGEVLVTTVTGADGRYRFEAVPAGRYTIEFGPLPSGLRFAIDDRGLEAEDSDADPYSGRAPVIVEGGRADLDVDAGVVTAEPGELGRIGDRVWDDIDADGIQDAGELGAAGVEVLLVGANTGQLSTTVTDADGGYSFQVSRAIAPDQPYRIVFAAPPGRALSPQDAGGDDTVDSDPDPQTFATANFTLGPDETNNSVDAGIAGVGEPLGAVGDFVWNDVDGDGIQGAGEPAVSGVAVSLIDGSGTVVAMTVTDATGRYGFRDLPTGDYVVRFELPDGFDFTSPDQGSDDAADSDADPATGRSAAAAIGAGEIDDSVDAGLRAVVTSGATIGDFAWRDLDRDGVQEPGESGLPNVTVTLRNDQGAVVATAATEDGGLYSFTNVAPGAYRVRFTSPPGFGPTIPNVGADDAVDSDLNGGGESPLLTVVDGQVDLTIDGGFAPLA